MTHSCRYYRSIKEHLSTTLLFYVPKLYDHLTGECVNILVLDLQVVLA